MISPSFDFWTYLISNILSLLCSLFVLYHLLFDRTLRQALNNHVIIILLFLGMTYELTHIPWLLYRFRFGVPWIQSSIFYLFSYFFDYALSSTQIALFTWATIERHILIFHDTWVATRKKRFFVHYLPIAAVLIYYFVYYSVVTFGPFCEKSFAVFITGGVYVPCVFSKTVLGTWNLLVHQVIPTLLIVICSITLIIRILRQKRRINQPIHWRKHRKMTVQLISISVLYLFFNFPWTIIIFALQFGLASDEMRICLVYAAYLRPYIIFLFPFVCCGSLSELGNKFKKMSRCCHRQHRIAFEVPLGMTHALGGRPVVD